MQYGSFVTCVPAAAAKLLAGTVVTVALCKLILKKKTVCVGNLC